MTVMIRLENVTKRYGDKLAVDNFSIDVNAEEVCVIIGPSGSGKTTALRMINRLVEPSSGRILVDGRDILTQKPELLRRSIGYAIQRVGLFPHMTVAENIAVVPEILHWEKNRIKERVEELLLLVGLSSTEYALKYPAQLSGGEAQRVGVARALAANPRILLMDEPFGAVDPLNRERLQTQFLRIHQELKKTVVLITHDLDEAIRLADKIAIMNSGKLVQYDTPENILANPANKFVQDFVGTDRALKRLSRFSIKGVMKASPSVSINSPLTEMDSACGHCRWVWVVDEDQQLIGWLDRTKLTGSASVRESMVFGNLEEISLTADSTLRDALSRMLVQGLRTVPVVDDRGRLAGEVSFSDIEAVTAEIES